MNPCSTCPADIDTCPDLPGMGEMLELRKKHGADWACHSNPNKICSNFAWYIEELNLKPTGKLLHREGAHLDYCTPDSERSLMVKVIDLEN